MGKETADLADTLILRTAPSKVPLVPHLTDDDSAVEITWSQSPPLCGPYALVSEKTFKIYAAKDQFYDQCRPADDEFAADGEL